jgi:hypothetical protein
MGNTVGHLENDGINNEFYDNDNESDNNVGYNILKIESDYSNITSTLNNIEILESINWIEHYKPCMKEFDFLKDDLIIEYKERIREHMLSYFDKIKGRSNSIHMNDRKNSIDLTNNNLYTFYPSDIFTVIYACVKIAEERLPKKYCKEIAIVGLQLLQNNQRQSYDDLFNDWKIIEIERLCTSINDFNKMQELCCEFEEYLTKFDNSPENNMVLKIIIEELSNEYISLSMKIIYYLTIKVLDDLNIHYFDKLFFDEWFTNDGLNKILSLTLKDYFLDIMKWLPEYYFIKFIKSILKELIRKYILCIKNRTNIGPFNSEISAVAKILNDKKSIENIFIKYESFLKETLINELNMLDSLSKIILSRNYSHMVNLEGKIFCEKYGQHGLKIVQMAFKLNPSNK